MCEFAMLAVSFHDYLWLCISIVCTLYRSYSFAGFHFVLLKNFFLSNRKIYLNNLKKTITNNLK